MKEVHNCVRSSGKPGNKRSVWANEQTELLAKFYTLGDDPLGYGRGPNQKIRWWDVMWIVNNIWQCHFNSFLEHAPPTFDYSIPFYGAMMKKHLNDLDETTGCSGDMDRVLNLLKETN